LPPAGGSRSPGTEQAAPVGAQAGGIPAHQQLVSLYYDTPGLSLHRRGIALRLLRSLGTLQDELGQLHDLADAGVLLMHCAGDDFF